MNVSSTAHKIGNLDFNDLNWETRRYNKFRSYGDSKLANLYFTNELQKRLDQESSGVIVASAHPGAASTPLTRHSLFFRILSLFVQGSEMGALPTLYAAVSPDVRGTDYIGPGGFQETRGYPKKVESAEHAKNADVAANLWTFLRDDRGIVYLAFYEFWRNPEVART